MLPNPLHFGQICRLCMSNSEQLINLFNAEEDIISLLTLMTAVSMSPDDELPQTICPFCLHQIKTTHYFILKCQDSDRKLRQSIADEASKTTDADNVDNKFIDNEVSTFECTIDEESIAQIGEEESELNEAISALQSDQEIRDRICFENAQPLMDDCETLAVLHTETIEDKTSKTKYVCETCTKSFSNLKSLERHKSTHKKHPTIETMFQCTVCGKQMKHINHFNMHMRSHRGAVTESQNISTSSLPIDSKKKFVCPTCGRACTSQSNLAVHVRRHTGLMTNFCKVCGKGYPRSTDLTIHMRKHTGERPFVCSICCRCFARSDKLTIHVRTHTGERPYKCTGCSKSFAQRNDLLTHQRRNVCGSNKSKNDTRDTVQHAA